jgi:hypothetical protein
MVNTQRNTTGSRRLPILDGPGAHGSRGTRQYGWDMPAALVPVLVLLVILAIDLLVYADAKQRADQGAPVVLRIGAFVLETPETWFVVCLVLWIIFFPLYMVSRAG